MKWEGPDNLNSWLISLVCCFINSMTFGMSRLSGVLFVASISRFKVGRKQASFPYTFAAFLRNLSGPLVGYLGHKYGVRTITVFGALLGAFGAFLCYFAESILVVTIFWGAMFGLGFGLGNILLPVSINQYFEKHRATASGISFSGACLGSFILPPVVEILLDNYGLSQTYLFLSGFILNCVPAALLLRKPNFELHKMPSIEQEQSEKKPIISHIKKPLYTLDNQIVKNSIFMSGIQADEGHFSNDYKSLSYEEKMKQLSTETLLSEYLVDIKNSKHLNVDQKIEKIEGCGHVDPRPEQAEGFSFSGKYNTLNNSALDIELKQPKSCFNYSNESPKNYILCAKENKRLVQNSSYQNYNYQSDFEEDHNICEFSNNTHIADGSQSCLSQDLERQHFNQKSNNKLVYSAEHLKIAIENMPHGSNTFESLDIENHKHLSKSENLKTKDKSTLGSFSVIFEPMFIIIAITNAIYSSSFLCMLTIIVDFSRDLHIEASNEKYILMLLSVGDITGRLGLGWVTDRGYLTTCAFASVCFASQGFLTAAIVWSNDFMSLAILITLYGLAQAGIIVIYPIIIAQYIERDKQTVAITSSHFLSGPFCLAIAPLIGHFRDEVGAYDWIFYGMAILSAACSLSWFFAPCIAKCRKKRYL